MSESVVVLELPPCDICVARHNDPKVHQTEIETAAYDGATHFGSWAYMCEKHFRDYGTGLGTGRGQRLIVEDAGTTGESDA